MFGLLGTLVAGIGGLITTVKSALIALTPTIGAKITEFGGKVLAIISDIPKIEMEDILNITKKIGDILSVVGDILGIDIEDKPEEIGQKMLDADKKLSDFDNDAEEYIKYLNEEIELDKEKMKDLSPEDILLRQNLAIGLAAGAIGKKLDADITPELLVTYAKIECLGKALNSKECIKIVDNLKKEGIINFKDISDYLEVKGNIDTIETGSKLRDAVNEALGITDSKDIIDELQKELVKFDADKI